jgi:carboxyl-terminal processing protease
MRLVQRPRLELLIPAAIVAAVVAAAVAALRDGATRHAAQPETARHRHAPASANRSATADHYVESLRDTLLERHPSLENVTKEELSRRALAALRDVVAEERATTGRAAVDELALARAFDWDALCADWLGKDGGDDDPRIDARVDLLANALLEAVGDPFTQRVRGDHFLNLSKLLEAQFPTEVGLFLDRDADGIYVRAVLRDSDPAAKGLRAGDRVLAIDGEPVAGRSLRSLEARVAHPCRLSFTRPGFDAPVEFDLFSCDPTQLGVRSCKVADDVGWVSFPLFNGAGFGGVLLESRKLLRGGAKALILDLRGNLGGFITEAVAVANLFLAPGLVVTRLVQRGEEHELPDEYDSEVPAFGPEIPLVVLVDRSSASASELVTGALKDHHRALIVGEPTFGKGIGQTMLPLLLARGASAGAGDGALPRSDMLWLTSLRFLSPNGTDHHGVGIAPDLVAPRAADSRARIVARARLLADANLVDALARLELSAEEQDQLARPGPPPASVVAAATGSRITFAAGADDEREALKDVARLALARRHPRLAACPELDPALKRAVDAAHFALRRAAPK